MGSYRTSKESEVFYDTFTVFDFDQVSTVSGETAFTVTFVHDGTDRTGDVTYSISEIGSSGDYLLTVSSGFPDTGLWVIDVVVAYNLSTWRTHVEVLEHDIDDVYDVIVAGGSGTEAVLLTVVDTNDSDAPIPDVLINIFNSDETAFITFGRTDEDGEKDFSLNPGDYTLRLFRPGVSFDVESLTVPIGGGDFEIEATSVVISPPPQPNVCRLYADFVDMDGNPASGFKITITNLFDSEETGVVEDYQEAEADDLGHLEVDVVQGTHVRVAFISTKLTRDIIVPSVPVADLLTVFGATADAFTVVRAD